MLLLLQLVVCDSSAGRLGLKVCHKQGFPKESLMKTSRKYHENLYSTGAVPCLLHAVQLVVCDSPAGRLGLTVCYDLRFPEVYQTLTWGMGAEVLLVPSAFTKVTGGQFNWHSSTVCAVTVALLAETAALCCEAAALFPLFCHVSTQLVDSPSVTTCGFRRFTRP
jgi:predicted amidohydrolase